MSKVTRSYNSYEGLSKRETIKAILKQEQRPLCPKEISVLSKLNHSTVRVYCRRMLGTDLQRPFPGYYVVTESMDGVIAGSSVLVHNVGLVWQIEGLWECRGQFEDMIGGVKMRCQVGSQRGKVSAVISCDEGMDYHTVCFAVDRIRQFGLDHGVNLDVYECSVCCELNQDYQQIRLDGVKCATVKSFLGDLERIYQKGNGVRSEIKVQHTDLSSMYTMLKGGVTVYNVFQSNMLLIKRIEKLTNTFEQYLKNHDS